MSGRCILTLNAQRLAVYAWNPGRLTAAGEFPPTPEGLSAFATFLATLGSQPCMLLCNLAEESHLMETIPYLRGSDRRTLLARKCTQAFYGTPFTTVRSLGHEKERRRNEKVLLSALTAPAQLTPWVSAITAAHVPLAGLYTVSQLGDALVRTLCRPPPRSLLLTVHDQALRESYLVDGKTVFSRMAPLYDASPEGLASTIAAEGQKLHQYLAAQRHFGRNDALPVFVIAPDDALPALEAAATASPLLHPRLIGIDEASRALGLHGRPAGARCGPLFAYLLGKGTPAEQYAPDEARHDYAIHRIKQGLIGAGAVALIAALLFSGKQLAETYADREEVAELQARSLEQRQRYAQITATFPQLGIDNDALRAAVDRYRGLEGQAAGPGALIGALARALDASPAIEVEAIDWRLGEAEKGSAPAAPGSTAGETALIRGSVTLGRESEPRQVVAVFTAFVEQLRLDPELKVTVRQQPFDVDPSQSLRGGTREEESAPPRSFALLVSRPAP
ncbi:MAG: hypothetical protein KA603_08170 [Azonexus sp.]|nr:hypothetical protein [Betaproteobacteria bacterium]MBK8916950.1 hypothetical protein [Betaproteobacteria bacterium]MBP6036093.1 hypothetical protein [Azonexus sp.]MBP6906616.1 hypothetical protein [Azonexus sp.]